MAYVDGFVLVVPKKKRAAYKKMAEEGKALWLKRGALDYKECRLDHKKPNGVAFTFEKMTKAKKGDEVWFSYVLYKDKKQRDAIAKAVEKDMIQFNKEAGKTKKEAMAQVPFDMKRMAYGGFTVEVSK